MDRNSVENRRVINFNVTAEEKYRIKLFAVKHRKKMRDLILAGIQEQMRRDECFPLEADGRLSA